MTVMARKSSGAFGDFDDLWSCPEPLSPTRVRGGQRWRGHVSRTSSGCQPAQYRLLLAWLGDRLDLCVGHPNQPSIRERGRSRPASSFPSSGGPDHPARCQPSLHTPSGGGRRRVLGTQGQRALDRGCRLRLSVLQRRSDGAHGVAGRAGGPTPRLSWSQLPSHEDNAQAPLGHRPAAARSPTGWRRRRATDHPAVRASWQLRGRRHAMGMSRRPAGHVASLGPRRHQTARRPRRHQTARPAPKGSAILAERGTDVEVRPP